MPILQWIGKEKVVNHHLEVPCHVLSRTYSFDEKGQKAEDNGSENMVIHGDNLLALKSLLPKYEGRVKCIYIDPPYNTGNEGWVYNDAVNDPVIKRWLGEVVGKEGEDLSRHDKWLCMMYPRLRLLQRLLSDDGAIFISIGEDEHASLKLICDEIFGIGNYITDFSRQMKSGGAKGHFYTPSVDYVLAYAKNISLLPYFRTVLTQKQIDVFYKFVETTGPMKGEKYGEERLFKSSLEARANQRYYIKCPDGSFAIPPGETLPSKLEEGLTVRPVKSDKVWKWTYLTYKREKEKGNIVFKKTTKSGLVDEHGYQSKWNIYNKVWLKEQQEKGVVPSNLILGFENRQSAAELKQLQIKFDYAKPIHLLEYLFQLARLDSGIVLDSFAGSGTTAQAVLNMNMSDGGNRKFILIEMGDYADSITAERVKRVIHGYGEGKKAVSGTGGDFSFYELGAPLMKDGFLNEDASEKAIRDYVYFMDTRENRTQEKADEPYFLGTHQGAAYYFYYKKGEATVLSYDFLATVKTEAESYVMYADSCLLSAEELSKYHITFKKIPRDIARL
ncbi:MAG: site-specific DNA-methyltransferase [Dialister sp.]|nr:site-specific DNA-methyltransferase [Dialister sp.]